MYDFIIIGSGIAGLYVALLAEQHGRVLLLTKAGLEDSNTNHAQGGIAAALGADDSPALHWRDTLVAGAGLSDPVAAWILTCEGPERIASLIRCGVPFDREDSRLAMAREGAHSRPRVLHAGGDATGAQIQTTLGRLIWQAKNVTVREHHLVTDLVVIGGAVRGVVAREGRATQPVHYTGRNVVLATGGAGQLYQHTTNPAVATGTGLALAYRAGASLADLEFCQFHPTALLLPNAPRFLISEAARGEGGILRNADGRRFMFDYDALGELAPRHVVAAAILAEMTRDDRPCVYLDLTHLPAGQVLRRFPVIAAFCRQHNLDITRTPIPVAPAAHYMMGGVRTDLWGATDLPGLFACGEVACTGVHGANRLASNSLLEALVFGERIVRRSLSDHNELTSEPEPWLAGGVRPALTQSIAEDALPLASSVLEDHRFGLAPTASEARWPRGQAVTREEVQSLMWACAGMSRSRQSLQSAQQRLAQWSASLPGPTAADCELHDLLLVARLVVAAALAREESRGAHRRRDFPAEDGAWRRRLVFRARETALSRAGCVPLAR